MELLPIDFVYSMRKENELGHDGLVYEDSYVTVERKNNQLIQTGKPIRSPFIYMEEEK